MTEAPDIESNYDPNEPCELCGCGGPIRYSCARCRMIVCEGCICNLDGRWLCEDCAEAVEDMR